ncbi:MAG TPA: hypothetical protein VK509_20695 [Polyangiales bacterium]|nr:hypothetical protein [Polyangiales bacterium]
MGYSAELRPKGSAIASVDTDVLLKNRILMNDGIETDSVAVRTGFAAGAPVSYWDFGVAPASLEPIWTFVRRAKDGSAEPIDHPDLIDSIPGDMSYSPFRALYEVFVTSAYAGERITSLRALEDAIELGLVEDPAPPTLYVDRPVAPAGTRLPPDAMPEPVYYRGRVAAQFRIGGAGERRFAIPMMGPLSTPNAYALRRHSASAALDEVVWKADLDGDGDQNDSNLVLAVDGAAPGYSALWRPVEVIVPDDYGWGTCRGEADLFERGPAGLQARLGAVERWQANDMMLRHLVLIEASGE